MTESEVEPSYLISRKQINGFDGRVSADPYSEYKSMVTREGPDNMNEYVESDKDGSLWGGPLVPDIGMHYKQVP